MKSDVIPSKDSVARYCPFSRLSEDGRPSLVAFQLSRSDLADDHPHLSVNWLEYFRDDTRENQINRIKVILAKKIKVGAQARIAICKIEEIHKAIKEIERQVRVLHWPVSVAACNDESHSGIFDVEVDADVIALKLSQIDFEIVTAK